MSEVQPDSRPKRITHTWQCLYCGFYDQDHDAVAEHIKAEHGLDVAKVHSATMDMHTHKWTFLRRQDNGADVFFCESCLEYRLGEAPAG